MRDALKDSLRPKGYRSVTNGNPLGHMTKRNPSGREKFSKFCDNQPCSQSRYSFLSFCCIQYAIKGFAPIIIKESIEKSGCSRVTERETAL